MDKLLLRFVPLKRVCRDGISPQAEALPVALAHSRRRLPTLHTLTKIGGDGRYFRTEAQFAPAQRESGQEVSVPKHR